MPHVAFLLHPRALLTGLTIPMEMLRAADEFDRVQRRDPSQLSVSVVTTDDQDFVAFGALTVAPQLELAKLTHVDVLFVPPFWRRPVVDLPEVIQHLKRLEREGASLCAVSTGSYLLAEAGLLDGRVATTHWSFLDDFAARYPRTQLKRHHLITRSERIFCAGSLNATADLTAYFIETWFGSEIAHLVVAQFSPEIRRPAQQQGYFDGETNQQPDELMAFAQAWLRERSAGTVHFTELAQHLGIARRSLNRRFLEATGRTPGRYLQEVRIENASALLRNTNLSIAEVASRVGCPDAAYFSSLYRRLNSQSPSSYRNSVRAKLFSVG